MEHGFLGVLTDDEDFLELYEIVEHPRNPQTYRARENHFTKWNDVEFKERFRLSKEVVAFVVEEISELISSQTERNQALSPTEMVFVTLRFLATGSISQVAGDFNGIDKSTTSRVINKVTRAIASLKNRYIKMPEGQDEMQRVCHDFFNISRFPRCIGAIDCTHVKIQSVGGDDAEIYRNRKGFFSFNVQCVCDANLKILNIVCRWPGATHDSQIFRNSRLKQNFERGIYGDYVLVGDSGYGIKPYLITPLANTQNAAENLFNESQIRTRNPIERCFGVLKRRFPILALGIRINHRKVEAVVIAAAILHNIACIMKDPTPIANEEIEAAINLMGNIPVVQANNFGGINNRVRHSLITEYFARLL